jgi:hypothetical protein
MNKLIDVRPFETAVCNIADTLLSSIQMDDDGPFWQRARMKDSGTPALLPETNDIFNGSAGTILFFLALYRYNNDERYISCCRQVLNRLLKKTYNSVPAYYTFYTGATGLIYICVNMYEVTGDKHYIREGIRLADYLEMGICNGVVKDDLLSGHAGNLLAIGTLYAYSGSGRILSLLRRICDILISHCRISYAGLKWDNEKFAYDSLTGFSHGAAGIAYALLETGRYFDDEALRYLGEQALAYEMQYYDAQQNNWMDLRVNSLQIPAAEIPAWDLDTFRKRMSNTCSWAHGAAGACLARLHAYDITNDMRYADQAYSGIQRILKELRQPSRSNYTLCSGYGGHIMLLLKASQVLDDQSLHEAALTSAQDALNFFRNNGTYNTYSAASAADPALLSGLAGVGYMYLQFLLPYTGNTILHPLIAGKATDHGGGPLYDINNVKATILGGYFKQTLALLPADSISFPHLENITDLQHALSVRINIHAPPDLQEAFALENAVLSLWTKHKGMLCYRKKEQQLRSIYQHMELMDDNTLKEKKLQVCSHARLHHDSSGYKVLYSHEKGVSMLPVNILPALILQQLRKPCTTAAIIDAIAATHFAGSSPTVQRQVSQSIIEQVRQLLQHGLITAA